MAREAKRNLVLIGFMGVGKSTVGLLCAHKLGYAFVDTDALLVERAGKTIPQIFEEEGEAAFRALESRIIEEVSARSGQVIATGGGAVLNPANALALREGGRVVLLSAKPDAILLRVGDRASRPLLAQAQDPKAHLLNLLAQRAPFYENAADSVVETSARSAEEVAEEVIALL